MPEFQYEGVNKENQKIKGQLEAQNEGELRMVLRNKGIRPSKIKKVGLLDADLSTLLGGSGVSTDDLVGFTRQLHVLLDSGMPLLESLELLSEQVTNKRLSGIISALKEKVAEGMALSEAFSGYPKVFPKIYIALVQAGESSGSLALMLKRLSEYMDKESKLKKQIRGALIYPVSVLGVGFGVIAFLLSFVIPQFESIYAGNDQELPAYTQTMIDLSHTFTDNLTVILGALAVAIFLLVRYVRSPEGKQVIDRMTFRLPLFGPLVQKASVARFSRTMATLVGSGVPLIDAIDICKTSMDHAVLEQAAARLKSEVESGKPIGQTLKRLEVFPKMMVEMVTVGENTGQLDQMLSRVSGFYEEEVENAFANMGKLMEPAVLVFLGLLVGAVMIAMYLPVFKMSGGGAGV